MNELSKKIVAWESCTLAQRLEDARLLLHLKGYLRDSENDRIKKTLYLDWEKEQNVNNK